MNYGGPSIYCDYIEVDYRNNNNSLKIYNLYRFLAPWSNNIQYLVNKYKLGVF